MFGTSDPSRDLMLKKQISMGVHQRWECGAEVGCLPDERTAVLEQVGISAFFEIPGIANSPPLPGKLPKSRKLGIYERLRHGMSTIHANVVNGEELPFMTSDSFALRHRTAANQEQRR